MTSLVGLSLDLEFEHCLTIRTTQAGIYNIVIGFTGAVTQSGKLDAINIIHAARLKDKFN